MTVYRRKHFSPLSKYRLPLYVCSASNDWTSVDRKRGQHLHKHITDCQLHYEMPPSCALLPRKQQELN